MHQQVRVSLKIWFCCFNYSLESFVFLLGRIDARKCTTHITCGCCYTLLHYIIVCTVLADGLYNVREHKFRV